MKFAGLFFAFTFISALSACKSETVSGIGGGGSTGTGTSTGDVASGGTGGEGGAGGGAAKTFQCNNDPKQPILCKTGVEFCKEQDSAMDTTWECLPIPASCTPADLCSCPDLEPGCALGDAPGAFTCGVHEDGSATVACFG